MYTPQQQAIERLQWKDLPELLIELQKNLSSIADDIANKAGLFEKRIFSQTDDKKRIWMEKELARQKKWVTDVYYASLYVNRANQLVLENSEKLDYFRDYSWNAYFHQYILSDMCESWQDHCLFLADSNIILLDHITSKS